jgi:hypothetical protein
LKLTLSIPSKIKIAAEVLERRFGQSSDVEIMQLLTEKDAAIKLSAMRLYKCMPIE